ncbi:MAG: hypothetical protein V3S06_02900 [candidate division Zixibacteria bacterium]
MTTVELLWNTLAVILTLCIFSFLIKDNPFYKFAERLVAGVAAGFWTMLVYHTLFVDKVILTMQNRQWAYIIPILLGLGMWTRFSKKWAWISRYSIAFYIGISTGVSVTVYMYTNIFKQIAATMIPLNSINNILVVVLVLCALFYFFFSKAHTGTFGVVSRIGIYTLMIGFGAGFGLTVMGRIALLVQRVIFIKGYVLALVGAG